MIHQSFKKILVANRGEIALRIIQTCREMNIPTVALYEIQDRFSLHVRQANECVLLKSPDDFADANLILKIAFEKEADAIHPGYGFLAEEPEFVTACEDAGITFIGPSSAILRKVRARLQTLEMVRAAGISCVETSSSAFGEHDLQSIQREANDFGYPVVIKSVRGGRGPAERLIRTPERLENAFYSALNEAGSVFGQRLVYLEKAIIPARQIGVQIIGDKYGNIVHLGERDGTLQYGMRKVIEEAPAPYLTPAQQNEIHNTALKIAHLFHYDGVGTVEFLMDRQGKFYFTEIKGRIQTEHPLTEMLTGVDLVREQIRIAAGQVLSFEQNTVQPRGAAILCRVLAEDPLTRLPSPGVLNHVRLPRGGQVRIDTFALSGCYIPDTYTPLIGKLTVWGENREEAIRRMTRSLEELVFVGVSTNISLIQSMLQSSNFKEGKYTTELGLHATDTTNADDEMNRRTLAVIAAILYIQRQNNAIIEVPDRYISGWHRSSRRLPE